MKITNQFKSILVFAGCVFPPTAALCQVQQTKSHFVVCIDPGHPSEVNSGYTVQNGTTETHVDWEVAMRLKKLLDAQGIRVVLTREIEHEVTRNKDRALIANGAHASLMIRLHCDAGASTGYALYYPDRQGTAQGKTGPSPQIINASEAAAGYLLEGIKPILQRHLVCGGIRGETKTLIGSKQGALTGSIFSQVPVVTMEMVVLSNPKDAAFAKTDAGQSLLAQAIAAGIAVYRLKATASLSATTLR